MAIFTWFAATFKQYPEIAIFLTLALGYYFGKFTFKGLGLGSVTATLLAGVLIGQIGITISQPLKATVFLLFLFAVGYGVGPQFVRGVADDLRSDGPLDRRHQPTWLGRRPIQEPAQLNASCLRRDLHVRHGRLCDRDRPAWPVPAPL